MVDEIFINKAIEKAKESKHNGLFPAGAIIVLNGQIVAESISDKFPGYSHSRSSLPISYYEGSNDNKEIISKFNEKMNYIHVSEFEAEAIKVLEL